MKMFAGQSIRTAIVLGLIAFAGRAATLVQRPYLQNEREDRVSILWSTRENLPGVVEYSADQTFAQSTVARVREFLPSATGLSYTFYQYRVDLTGLIPGTEYSYRVVVGGQDLTPDARYRFRTTSPGPFSFLVLRHDPRIGGSLPGESGGAEGPAARRLPSPHLGGREVEQYLQHPGASPESVKTARRGDQSGPLGPLPAPLLFQSCLSYTLQWVDSRTP